MRALGSAFTRSSCRLASCAGSLDILHLLLAQGADVGAATHLGDTPLQLASRAGHDRLVARLLQPTDQSQGPPQHLHAADRLGWTALHCACQHGSLSVVHLLLQVCATGQAS